MARDDSITVSFRLNLSREDDIEIQKFLLGDTMKICFGDKSKFIKCVDKGDSRHKTG